MKINFTPFKISSLHQGRMSAGQVGLFLFCLLLLSIICHLRSDISQGQTFDSASFHIDWGNFNMTSGKKNSTNYTLTDTVGQNAPGQYDSTGYVVKSGFQYIYEKSVPFSFSINNLNIDFGHLTPNVGSTAANILTVSTPTKHGYEVYVTANHPLTTIGTNATIPDTKCDSNNCSESVSGIWSNNSTYGFGFNASGDGTASYFTNNNYYRQFANSSVGENAQICMSENVPVENHTANITYKVLISSNQPAGNYQNSINFMAIPKY